MSCFALSWRVLSLNCLAWSCPCHFIRCLVDDRLFFHGRLSCLALFPLALSCLVLWSCLPSLFLQCRVVLSYVIFRCAALYCVALCCLGMCCLVLSCVYLVLCCVLSCLALWCLVLLSCDALSCLVLSCLEMVLP